MIDGIADRKRMGRVFGQGGFACDSKLPSAQQLKLTDTILTLTYLTGGAAILSIIVGEIVMAIRNKK